MRSIKIMAGISFSILMSAHCFAAYPVEPLRQYLELFRGFGSVEICAHSSLSYGHAIREKNRLALSLRREVGGPTSCYQMGQDRLIINSGSAFEHMACARIKLAAGCSFQ